MAVWVRSGFQLGLRHWEALIIMHLDYGTIWGAAPQFVPYSNCFIISAPHCRRPSWKPKRTQTATRAIFKKWFFQIFKITQLKSIFLIRFLLILKNPLHGFPRWPDHFFSSDSSWKPKRTQTATELWPFGFILVFNSAYGNGTHWLVSAQCTEVIEVPREVRALHWQTVDYIQCLQLP